MKYLTVINGSMTGLFVLDAEPNLSVTNTFMDYSADADARTGSAHIYNGRELGFRMNLGKTPRLEICATARMDTYYPRYILWNEFARGLTYSAVEGATGMVAKKTGVWELIPASAAISSVLELFNLNFYPVAVGESHQHIITPGITMTYHF